MERQTVELSERQLAEKVIHLHDVRRLGFRRIARTLKSEGIQISKDKGYRLFRKYKEEGICIEEDEELKKLKETEKKAQEDLRLLIEKEETRKRIANLAVEKAMASFEERKRLFRDEKRLFEFANVVMSTVAPSVWDEFKRYCVKRRLKLPHAVALAVGKQKEYEKKLKAAATGKRELDLYIAEKLKGGLDACKQAEIQIARAGYNIKEGKRLEL